MRSIRAVLVSFVAPRNTRLPPVTIGPVKRPVLRFPSGNYSKTGKELWAVKLDYAANAIPITYQGKKGKPQYVAVMSSGGASVGASPNGQALIVFSLP